ncbi:MAG: hypothetical protein ACM3TN_19510 [Alphaproteobacteria bacterium]
MDTKYMPPFNSLVASDKLNDFSYLILLAGRRYCMENQSPVYARSMWWQISRLHND